MEQTTVFGVGANLNEASTEALQQLLCQIERHGKEKSSTASQKEAEIRTILAERSQ